MFQALGWQKGQNCGILGGDRVLISVICLVVNLEPRESVKMRYVLNRASEEPHEVNIENIS